MHHCLLFQNSGPWTNIINDPCFIQFTLLSDDETTHVGTRKFKHPNVSNCTCTWWEKKKVLMPPSLDNILQSVTVNVYPWNTTFIVQNQLHSVRYQNPLLKYEVAFCEVLVHSLPAPISSQIGRKKYLLRSIISFLNSFWSGRIEFVRQDEKHAQQKKTVV